MTTWTHEDMILATLEFWGIDSFEPSDCQVVEATDGNGDPCLVVVHRPTGRTSDEASNAGRWHLDGTAF